MIQGARQLLGVIFFLAIMHIYRSLEQIQLYCQSGFNVGMMEGDLNWKSETHSMCHLKTRIKSHYLREHIGVLWERLAGITKFGKLK